MPLEQHPTDPGKLVFRAHPATNEVGRLARVEAQRDALLEALRELLEDAEFLGWDTAKARAAIKAVEEEK